MNSFSILAVFVVLSLSASLGADVSEKGAATIEQFSSELCDIFKKHKIENYRRLHHPTFPKAEVDSDRWWLEPLMDVHFEEVRASIVTFRVSPLKMSWIRRDGRSFRYIEEPDGVVKIIGKGGVDFELYFPYKLIGGRFFMSPVEADETKP